MLTKAVFVGGVQIGGGARVSVQSMTNTPTEDVQKTLAQIQSLFGAGAEIVRVSVYNEDCARAVKELVLKSPVPLVADIHFDHKLAIRAIENGIAKVRINPGNIGGEKNVAALADCLKMHKIPVRIGVNSGSVEREILDQYGGVTAEGIVKSGLTHARMLERRGFDDIVLSFKATSVPMTVEACRIAAKVTAYPQHVGITESGTYQTGIIKSAAGIGALLLDGIGDTIRVSLTGDPVREVTAGIEILRAVGCRRDFVEVVSCPTCGRTAIDVEKIAKRVRAATEGLNRPLKVAVMGCVVNGPGEAKEADIGIAGGGAENVGALFIKGEQPRAVHGDLAKILIDEIQRIVQ